MEFIALFPGLPHFFCSSVCIDNNTQMRKGGVSLSTQTKEQKKRGRPGNEAMEFRFKVTKCIKQAGVELPFCHLW